MKIPLYAETLDIHHCHDANIIPTFILALMSFNSQTQSTVFLYRTFRVIANWQYTVLTSSEFGLRQGD